MFTWIENYPLNHKSHYWYGAMLWRGPQFENRCLEAASHFQIAIQLKPTNIEAHLYFAKICYVKIKDFARMRIFFSFTYRQLIAL